MGLAFIGPLLLPRVGGDYDTPITDRNVPWDGPLPGLISVSALSKALSGLSPEHRAALEWFHERRGQQVSIPKRFNGTALLNAQTGIQKPAKWQHALSVKQTLKQNYLNSLQRRSDGSWLFVYAQQKADAVGSQQPTNNSVKRAAADQCPVAVVLQTRAKGPALYDVLGLAQVAGWSDRHFRFEGYNDAGELSSDAALLPQRDFVPITRDDWRKKVMAEISVREGAKPFKDAAIADYEGRCLLSGATEPWVLQAAHIVPYLGVHTNERDNAILLRADLHILFDREAIWIDPETLTVKIQTALKGAEYTGLEGRRISLPPAVDAVSFAKRLAERDAFLAEKPVKKAGSPKAKREA